MLSDSMYKPIVTNDATIIIRNNTNLDHETNMIDGKTNNNNNKIEYVTVTAPTNLPSGYELVVDTNGSFWTVQVPDGGVSMNESFQAVVLRKTQVAKAELVGSSRTKLNFDIPTGRWRDGIFDCFIIEPIHSQCCLTWCFPYIALGQIMTRLNLNVCGQSSNIPRSEQGYCKPFYVMCIIAFTLWFFNFINIQASLVAMSIIWATPSSPYGNGSSADKVPVFQPGLLYIIVAYAAMIYMIVVHTKTRNKLRRKYRIGTNDSCLGDCCCATFCSGYSICQMARHTAEYHHTHRARCCTETGLDEEWDEYDYETSIEGTTSQSTPFIV